jgi:GT2 family glycosyltransferase
MADLKVCAIIINWNSYDNVRACVSSLLNSSLPFMKLIIVDNGSTDGSIDKIEGEYLLRDQVVILKNDRNLGFAAGMNVGIRHALSLRCDYIFIFNNDAVIDPDCVRILTLESEKFGAEIAGPRIFYKSNRNKIWQGGGYFNYLKAGVRNPEKNKFMPVKTKESTTVDFVTGCAMLVKAEVFVKLGLYDEDYFFYTEDLDFCLNARRKNMKVLFVPEARAYHDLEGISKSRTSPYVLYHLARSTVIFFRKNFGVFYFTYAMILHFLLYTPYRLFQSLIGGNRMGGWFAWIRGSFTGLLTDIRHK